MDSESNILGKWNYDVSSDWAICLGKAASYYNNYKEE